MTATPAPRDRRGKIGFGDSAADGKDGKKALERVFTPEFRNRLDATVFFDSLPVDVIRKVARKFLDELDGQLARRRSAPRSAPRRSNWFVEHGYDKAMGARPMARLVQSTLKAPLANEILFGKLASGGIARVGPQGRRDRYHLRTGQDRRRRELIRIARRAPVSAHGGRYVANGPAVASLLQRDWNGNQMSGMIAVEVRTDPFIETSARAVARSHDVQARAGVKFCRVIAYDVAVAVLQDVDVHAWA